MMMLRIYNTLTRNKEEFKHINDGKVKMYACGITVNGRAHIGHAVQAVIFDIIRKYEKLSGEVCVYCGEPATHETYGWINYVCEKCLNEHQLSGRPIGEDEEDYFEEGEE
jgi:valyl-tRNA synthetase